MMSSRGIGQQFRFMQIMNSTQIQFLVPHCPQSITGYIPECPNPNFSTARVAQLSSLPLLSPMGITTWVLLSTSILGSILYQHGGSIPNNPLCICKGSLQLQGLVREEDGRLAQGKGELEQETVMEMLRMTENLNSMGSRDNTLAEEKDGGVRARGTPRMAQRV